MKKNIFRILTGAIVSAVSCLSLVFTACSGDLHMPLESTIVPGEQPSVTSGNYFYFKATAQDTYYVWMWDDAGNGGEAYTVAAVWPGDAMFLVGPGTDGGYIYKYYITTTEMFPSSIIISKDSGDSKLFDGAGFVNHGLYIEGSTAAVQAIEDESTITTTPTNSGNSGNNGTENSGNGEGNNGNGEEPSGTETPAATISLEGFVVKGDFGDDIALTADSQNAGVYTIALNYRNTMTGWGGGNGSLNLKLNSGSTWYGATVVDTASSTTLPEGVTIGGTDNILIAGLTDLTSYKISFSLTTDKTKIIISVEKTGTFDAPTGPATYDEIQVSETAGELPNKDYTLDESTGALYTVTGVPGWYGDADAAIWGVIKVGDAQYWKRLKLVKADGALYFTTNLNPSTIEIRRYDPTDLTKMWNSSDGALTITNNVAQYPAQ